MGIAGALGDVEQLPAPRLGLCRAPEDPEVPRGIGVAEDAAVVAVLAGVALELV